MTHQTGDFRMTAKRIVVLAGDYVEDYEIMVPFQALQMLGLYRARHLPGQDRWRAGEARRCTTSKATRPSEKPGHRFTFERQFCQLPARLSNTMRC